MYACTYVFARLRHALGPLEEKLQQTAAIDCSNVTVSRPIRHKYKSSLKQFVIQLTYRPIHESLLTGRDWT